jgi:hypothetical protein
MRTKLLFGSLGPPIERGELLLRLEAERVQ